MCALGIYKLRQQPAGILLLGRHAEQNILGANLPVGSLDIGDGEAQFDPAGWTLLRSRVQCERGFARHELAPARRLELQLETDVHKSPQRGPTGAA